jgi:hypothetical protein
MLSDPPEKMTISSKEKEKTETLDVEHHDIT